MRSRWAIVLTVLLVLGGVLRTVQYAGRVSLWHDELALARNIEGRTLGDLVTRPLDHRQIAPAGFLAAVKLSTELAGVDELGLRLMPWLAGLLSLPLFWRVTTRFASGPPLVAAVALFAMSPALIWYGASVKQYGTDVTASLLLVWLALRFLERPERRLNAVVAAISGAAAMLVSHPAIVTGFVLGCLMLVFSRGDRWSRSRASLFVLAAGWAAGALAGAVSAMRLQDSVTSRFMHEFWRDGFPPALSDPLNLIVWLPRQLVSVFAHFLLFLTPLPIVLAIAVPLLLIALAGVPRLWRTHPRQAALVAAPLIAAVAAAAAGVLPFRHRLGLHAVWPILVFAGAGLTICEARLRLWQPRLAHAVTILAAAPLMLMVLLAARPPYDSGQETRPVVEHLARVRKPGDAVYVSCGARHAVAFYGARNRLGPWMAGECAGGGVRTALREADAFRGRARLWYVSMLFPNEDARTVRAYLATIGREEEVIQGASLAGRGARIIDLYRFDLSDPARFSAATADAFPIQGPGDPRR